MEARDATSAKVDASDARVLAAYRAMVSVLKLVVGEDAVYEHPLTFDPCARKPADAEPTDDTETA